MATYIPTKNEDDASANADQGVPVLIVRKDTPANTSDTDGDYETPQMSLGRVWAKANVDNAAGASAVNIQDGGNSITVDGTVTIIPSGTQTVDTELPAAAALADAASAAPTTPTVGHIGLVMNATTVDRQRAVVAALDSVGTGIAAAGIVGQLDDTSTAAVTENQFAPVRISTRRALLVEGVASGVNQNVILASNTGVDIGKLTANQSVNVAQIAATATAVNNGVVSAGVQRVTIASDSTGNIATIGTSVTPGTAAANLGKAEDAVHASGDVGVLALAVRDDTIGATSGTEGDYEALHTNENGALWIEVSPSTLGGLLVGNFTSGDTYTALTATAQVIKATAGKFYGYYIFNPNTSIAYVMVYNIAAASVTVGTSTAVLVFAIPASSGANLALPIGIPFGTAMSIAAATTGGGNTAPTTALEAMIWYK